jgi:hypothetical protein
VVVQYDKRRRGFFSCEPSPFSYIRWPQGYQEFNIYVMLPRYLLRKVVCFCFVCHIQISQIVVGVSFKIYKMCPSGNVATLWST